MPWRGFDEVVKSFLATQVSSVEELEILILLLGAPAREWSAGEVGSELRADVLWVQERLDDLTLRGFLVATRRESGSTFHYAPADPDVQRAVAGAARAYKERRTSVIRLIYEKNDGS